MYSERIIEQKLSDFAAKNGWMPRQLTISEVDELKSEVAAITTTKSNQKNTYITISKSLSTARQREIRRKIENEQVMCAMDQQYWATRYAFICNAEGEIFKYAPRASQKVFHAVVAQFEAAMVAIELFCLKGRQVGISTEVALKFLHRLLFISMTQAVMASVQSDKSELLSRILDICFERCPWWLVPQRTGDRIKRTEFSNGSILSIQSGSQPTGIAQGWSPTCIHISEVGDIPNPKKVIEEGLLKAAHSSRKLFQVFEGTGNGNVGWQADYWRMMKDEYPKGQSRFCPVFIPPVLATDLYPHKDWLLKFPIPDGWQPGEETRKHVQRCELYIRSTDYLRNIVGANYSIPREYAWFWDFNYAAAVKTHTQKTWKQQMPADDYEALTGKNDLVFSPEVIEVQDANRKRDYQAYALVGNSVDDGFEPDPADIDYNLPRIPVHHESHRGDKYDWLLIPLLPFDDSLESRTFDKILIYEPPKEGREYAIGIDTADGLNKEDEDRGALVVTRTARGNFPDCQVAEFTSLRVNPPQMVAWAAVLGAWYGQSSRDSRGAKFCIEQRERPGDDCQFQLKLMGFSFQHRMIRYDGKVVKENAAIKEGWYSTAWSVPMLTNRFVDAINNGWYIVNSRWMINELTSYERRQKPNGKTVLIHQAGKKDDRIRAAAQSYFTMHHMDVLLDRSKRKYEIKKSSELPRLNTERASLTSMSVGD